MPYKIAGASECRSKISWVVKFRILWKQKSDFGNLLKVKNFWIISGKSQKWKKKLFSCEFLRYVISTISHFFSRFPIFITLTPRDLQKSCKYRHYESDGGSCIDNFSEMYIFCKVDFNSYPEGTWQSWSNWSPCLPTDLLRSRYR